ncbi:MAG TPA: hypothetical protein PKO33_09400 [Pyrinomonadaceae bacterium]|nr:hypothetical protein [Pyrinomonadaceae bacterium]
MANCKAHNSILFLTTLSVYLGLVLVGGSPSVMAHAALTQKLEIAHDFEAEDDLDKKPDDEAGISDYAAVCWQIARFAVEFTEANRDKFPDGAYSYDYSVINDPNSQLLLKSANGKSGVIWGGFARPLVELNETIPWFAEPMSEKFRVAVSIDNAEVNIRTSFNRNAADLEPTAAFYNQIIQRRAVENTTLRPVYLNTEVSHQTNRLIVVTRLPRASIDEALPKSN